MQRSLLRRSFPPNRAAGSPVDDRIWLGPVPTRSRASLIGRAMLARVLGSRIGLAVLRAGLREPRVRAEERVLTVAVLLHTDGDAAGALEHLQARQPRVVALDASAPSFADVFQLHR